jgi:hypothetical protein
MINKNEFKMNNHGRCGTITYKTGCNKIVVEWEMSGSPEYDILLAPMDIREWNEPKGIKIPLEMQKEFLQSLRSWFKYKGLKSDIDFPLSDVEDIECILAGCDRNRLKGSAYCSTHYDELLLTK